MFINIQLADENLVSIAFARKNHKLASSQNRRDLWQFEKLAISLKLSATNHALKFHIGSRPFRYRKKNTHSKKAITAPHPSFILYPINIIAITVNITRIIREMNSKEKAGSSPIPNNPIYSKNITSSRASFAEPYSSNFFSGDANAWPISTAKRESISGR